MWTEALVALFEAIAQKNTLENLTNPLFLDFWPSTKRVAPQIFCG
jgi:hypothetical protein